MPAMNPTRALTLIILAAVGLTIASLPPGNADAHRVTNTTCHTQALARAREVLPATRAEVHRYDAACRRLGATHNAAHVATCNAAGPRLAIRCAFPASKWRKAWRIAVCESTADAPLEVARARGLGRWAVNGEHVGLLQLGDGERAAHGNYAAGAPAIVQARTAARLVAARGWNPWEGYGCA